MAQRKKQNIRTEVIPFRQVLAVLLKKWWLLGLSATVCAVAVYLVSRFLMTPMYQSTAMFYIANSGNVAGDGFSSSDIAASQQVAESCIVILSAQETLDAVARQAGVQLPREELQEMIQARPVDEALVLQVDVTGADPQTVGSLAEAIAEILPERVTGIMENTYASLVHFSGYPTEPSFPSPLRNAVSAFLFGFVFAASAVLLRDIFDTNIHDEADIARACRYPVLASVPDLYGSSDRSYGRKGKRKPRKRPLRAAAGIDPQAAEAYKRLRTMVQFSFSDERDCHVIGVSSAVAGEGKSTSAVQLACALAQLEQRVLLVDCDLRRPTVAEKLSVRPHPGLSEFLTRQAAEDDIMQYTLAGDADFFTVCAGRVPPNPLELLNSRRMEESVARWRGSFDCIILDLPPVGEVSDALTVAGMTDGILLVCRQDYCSRSALAAAVEQFEYVNARILGVVLNQSK